MAKHETTFKVDADKVVRAKEWRKNKKALYKSELSGKEKAYLNLVDRPLSIITLPIYNLKLLFNKTYKGGAFCDSNLKIYHSGAAFTELYKEGERCLPRNKFSRKLAAVAARAFEKCADHKDDSGLRGVYGSTSESTNDQVDAFLSKHRTTITIKIDPR